MSGPISPECRDRFKHAACAGLALDEDSDEIVDCACECHKVHLGYVCERCGRAMPEMEAWRSDIGPLCHPDDPDLPDCYSLSWSAPDATEWCRHLLAEEPQ